jgi:hypothetical protein
LIAGNFNVGTGSSSSVIDKISDSVNDHFKNYKFSDEITLETLNGGCLNDLKNIDFKSLDVLLWAPNISNDEEKIIPNIKLINPHLFLISSKRVVEKEYNESDIVGRLLKTRSNLGIMITKSNLYNFKLLDPLGNCYSNTEDINVLSKSLVDRVLFIKSLKRVGSVNVGEKRDFVINEDFLKFVKYSAKEFTKHVNAINPNRLLGNASTRCMFGFPAEKNEGRIFVTQRNIDKELIKSSGFVEVSASENVIEYYGDKKPSVDSPIQVKLFNYYKNINYMVHGHVYIESAEFTKHKLPCGYIEEFDEIIAMHPSRDSSLIVINLLGHGCILMSSDVESLWSLPAYTSRDFPEY